MATDRPALSIVIPTLGRAGKLGRVLDRLERQHEDGRFEVIVVADASEADVPAVDAAARSRPYPVRRLGGQSPGASAARNVGWRAASSELVLFLDDDVLPERHLVSEHLSWHVRNPEPEVGVLGRVRWADELKVTPFMRWLEDGIQFDYGRIEGVEAGWGRFFTANASVKRTLIERAGGFNERDFPFGYEDLDLALRMEALGFRLLYNRAASAEHLHQMDLEMWRRRVVRIARSERRFVQVHPEIPPYFLKMFEDALKLPPARGRAAAIAGFVPRGFPGLGSFVWNRAGVYWRQSLAKPFLNAWAKAGGSS